MQVLKTRITEGGRVVIPAKLRKQFNLKIGQEIILSLIGDSIVLLNKKQALKIVQSIFKMYSSKKSLAKELLAERRKEKE